MQSGTQTTHSEGIYLMPNSGFCDRFSNGDHQDKVNIWLAPKFEVNHERGTKVYWVCNLSDICVSDCTFGMNT
jgi:hypothetical protein